VNQPFVQHIQELRRRLVWSVLALGVGSGLGYVWRDPILDWLQAPLHGTLYYSKITGAFEFLMQACLLVGVLLAIPVVVYNLISFIRPALPRPVSRARIASVVAASCLLTVAGVAFAYYVSLPAVLHFLATIDVSHLHPLIAADSYLSFVVSYLGVFAIIFQLPLLMLFIDRFIPLPPQRLKQWRKWVIVGSFTAALILPIAPDPVSQVMLALPIIVLYEVSLWLIVLAYARRSRPVRPQPTQLLQPLPAVPPRQSHTMQPQPVPRPAGAMGPRVLDLREH
jgi:sec-independent protein translocase protein TatC